MKRSTFGLRLLALAFSVATLFVAQSCLSGNDNKKTTPVVPGRGYYAISFATVGTYSYPTGALHIDSTYSIRWNRADSILAPSVRIQLYKGDTLVLTLTNGIATPLDTGNFTWSLAVNRPPMGSGSNYRIKISSTSDTTEWDYSQNFTIYSNFSGSLSITSPTLATVAQVGTALPISWVANGSIGAGVGISIFRGDTLIAYLGGSGQTSGNYTWVVTAAMISATNYRIRVYSSSDPSISAYSPYFRITTQYFGTLTITTPGLNATLASGTTSSIAWAATGSPGSTVNLQLYRDSSMVYTIVSGLSVLSTPYTTWNIPSGLPTSGRYRIRIISAQDAGISSLSEYFTITGITPDPFEADNQRTLARVILDSATQLRTLSYLDTDWVQINAAPGKRYLAGVQSTFLVYVYVADSNGTVINTYTGSSLQVPVIPAYVGRYYLMVRYYSTTAAYQGNYSLFLRGYDSTQSSFPVTFSAPGAGAVWAAGSAYDVSWVPDTLWYNPYVNLMLYQDTTLIMNIITSTANDGINNWVIPAGLPTGSNYRLKIANSGNTQIFGYSPTFTISGLAPDAYEADNVRLSAKAILDSVTQSRSLTYADTDWVQFTTLPAKRYVFNIQSGFTAYAEILDSNGVLLSSTSGTNLQTFFTPGYVGRHYIRIRYYSTLAGYQGTYTLNMRSYDTVVGFPVTFTSPAAGATLAAGSTYNINWVPDSGFYGTAVSFVLYRDTVPMQSIVIGTANDGLQSWTLPSGLTTAGDYRLRIVNYPNSTIFAYSPTFTISGVIGDAYEPDNQRPLAKVLLDSSTQSRTLTYIDTDWVQINAANGRRYLANIQSGFFVYAYVLDSNGIQLNSYTGSNLQIFVTPTYVGRYYLRIQYYSTVAGYQGPYSLSLRSYDPLLGFPITFTSPTAGSVLVAGSTYNIGWVPDSSFYGTSVNFSLYRDTVFVQTIVSGTLNDGIQSWTLPSGLTTAGDYRIRIQNPGNAQIFAYSPSFTVNGISADAYELDNTRLTAKPILDSSTQARTLTLSDSDWVQINTVAGRRYLVSIQSGFLVYAYMLDSNGVQLGFYNGTGLQISVPTTYNGRYYLRVQYYSTVAGYQGSYSLTLSSYSSAQTGFPVTFTAPVAGATLTAGTTTTVTWVRDTVIYGLNASFQLYRDTVMVMSMTTVTANSGTYSWFIPAGLATAGNYRIRIANYNNPLVFGFSPSFNISGLPQDAMEPNDSSGSATLLTPNLPKSNLSLTYLDRDWFRFTGTAGRIYVIRTISTPTTTVSLYSGLGATLLTSSIKPATDSVNSLAWYCPVDGQYSFQVTAPTTGNYSLEFQEFIGLTINVTSPVAGDSASRNLVIPIQWNSAADIRGFVDVFLYNSVGVIRNILVNATNTGSYNWVIPADSVALPAGSAYYIRVVSRLHSSIAGNSGVFRISNQACATACGSATTWDFEATNGGFTAGGTPATGGFQWGVPTYASGPTAAHSGTTVWGTNLTGPYSNSANYTLVTPSFTVPAAGNLTFWQWYITESCCEYEYVEISTNGGTTFTTLYTNYGGTSSNSLGWIQTNVSLAAYVGQNAILRFRFTSDASVTYPGWYIDDIDVR